jgi:predicted nuclease of predicted toxin-antitoxin system
MVKFLADVGVAPRIVDWLRANGYDARHLAEENLHRLSDGEIFQKATREQRVLLTFDLDFAEIVALSGSAEVSVILFRLKDTRVDFVLSRLAAILRESGHLLPSGVILLVEDTRHRIRRLPVQ